MTAGRLVTVLLLAPLATTACRRDPGRVDPAVTNPRTAPAQPRAGAGAASGRWVLDDKTCSLGFVGASLTQKHEGRFGAVAGIAEMTSGDPSKGSVTFEVTMGSLAIEPAPLQTHLASPDFFDVARFPTARFASTRITKAAGGDGYVVTGELTLHGITREISFPAAIAVRTGELVVRADLTLGRKGFGIVYPGLPDDLIADDVVVRIRIAAPGS